MFDATQKIERIGITEPQFLADGMLGTLAIKLRIQGFDTVYDKESSDAELIEIARESNRILLTSDHELSLRAKRSHVICVALRERTEVGRLVELLSKLRIQKIDTARSSRCSLCNGGLERKGMDRVGKPIYQCADCKKRYWRGAHWKKLETLFEKVNASLSKG